MFCNIYPSIDPFIFPWRSCGRWLIGLFFVILIISISTTVIHLGQDLIYADMKKKEVPQSAIYKKRQFDADINDDEDTDDVDDNEDEEEFYENETERMDVNGHEVNLKKSEIESVWAEVESQLKHIPKAEETKIKNSDKRATSLSYEQLERILYPHLFELRTFFDIDSDNVDELIKYWKEPGIAPYDSLRTKVREIQNYDLKETILRQDELHNDKLSYLYNVSAHHLWNTDYFYLYPFMYQLSDYPKHLLNESIFHFNLTQFVKNEIGHSPSRYPPKYDIFEIYSAKNDKFESIISKDKMYKKHEEILKNNYKEIELIFPENDTLLFAMMHKFGQRLKQNMQNDASSNNNKGAAFLRAMKKMEKENESSSSSKKEEKINRRRLDGFGVLDSAQFETDFGDFDMNEINDSIKANVKIPRIQNFNGMTSDISYFHKNKSTVKYFHNFKLDDPSYDFISGNLNFNDEAQNDETEKQMFKNYKFWRLHDHCVRRKGISVYPNWRILYASKPLTCDIIINKLLDPITQCLNDYGSECPMIIDHGYFRYVFKSKAAAKYLYTDPIEPELEIPIVLKVMKTKFVDWSADWLRHIRESVFLQQLKRWENEFMTKHGAQFTSYGQERAFYYVPELGHCLFPTFITVNPFYDGNLRGYVESGMTANMTLKKTIEKSMEILSGLQVLHNIEGGPYMHTDLQPRQFMIDDNENILINDFNRGKFQQYFFKESKDVIIPCTYCMPYSHGHWRAPEELFSDPLDKKLDIWSICLTIWNLFSQKKAWGSFGNNYDAIKYVLREYQMRPKIPYSVPPYLKDILRHCWAQNPNDRPDINELMRDFRYLYKHLHRLSDGREHFVLQELAEIKAYKETNYPNMEKIKSELMH